MRKVTRRWDAGGYTKQSLLNDVLLENMKDGEAVGSSTHRDSMRVADIGIIRRIRVK